MGYPCIARDCKKSVKIKSKDREIIQILHDKQKWSINKIARFFQVQSETISTNLNPEYRKKGINTQMIIRKNNMLKMKLSERKQ